MWLDCHVLLDEIGSKLETINGAATQALNQWEALTVQSDGTSWYIL